MKVNQNYNAWLKFLFGALLAGFVLTSEANATTYTYELEGHALSPLNHPLLGAPVAGKPWTYHYYNVNINRGDVLLTYNDSNTADFADDTLQIQGKIRVCTTSGDGPERCSNPTTGLRPGTFQDWMFDPNFTKDYRFEYTWDFTLENPIDDPSLSYTTTGHDNFSFGMQALGKSLLTSPYIPAGYTSVDYSIKTGPTGFAFQLTDDGLGEGVYRVSTWLMLQGGNPNSPFSARLESFRWDNLVNSDFRAYLQNPPPQTDVPEPTTALLLGSILPFGALARRKSRNINR